MPSLAQWLAPLLTAEFISAATAQICTPPSGDRGNAWFITAQSELDQIASECTTINGSLYISKSYKGRFYLPNVQNITEGISWVQDFDDYYNRPEPTSLELPDLEEIGKSLALYDIASLLKVSMPRLKKIRWSSNLEYVQEADFRALESVHNLDLRGNMTGNSLRLDSLRTVGQKLSICNKDMCDSEASPAGSLDISLPSLQSVPRLILNGRISSLEIPSLTKITAVGLGTGYGYGYQDGDFEISTSGGPPVNLTFPKLSSLDGWGRFDGDIGSLSMPSLRNANSTSLSLRSNTRIDIHLPFEVIGNLEFMGNISSVTLPNLKHLTYIFLVNSTLPLDCDAILKPIATAANITSYGGRLHCSSASDYEPSNSGLKTGAKVAIGVVVGVVGLAAIVGALWFLRKRRGYSKGEVWKMFKATQSVVPLKDTQPPAYGDVVS
ncbi:hypothetical protein BDW69DRAFT_47352 [Aspergillus filifer]